MGAYSLQLQFYFLCTYYAECSARACEGTEKPSLGPGEVGHPAEETRHVRVKKQTFFCPPGVASMKLRVRGGKLAHQAWLTGQVWQGSQVHCPDIHEQGGARVLC